MKHPSHSPLMYKNLRYQRNLREAIMKDFTLHAYTLLLEALQKMGYAFQTVEGFIQQPLDKVVILRHDVDSWPANALQMAKVEAERGIKATYYFRRSWLSYNEKVLLGIIKLGHEIGYHYEDLSACNGDKKAAIKRFEQNLRFYRQFYPVRTIAMHGRPLSPWDSKDLWKSYDYHKYGLTGEPYLDFDFGKMAYLTDTGNCWDGDRFSVRDHVQSGFKYSIHSTLQLIEHLKDNKLPNYVMLNVHPARWNDNSLKWCIRYYVLSLPKYQAKIMLKRLRNKSRL